VSIVATLTDGATALFTGQGAKLTRVADTEPTGPFSAVLPAAPRIDGAGTLWFRGSLRSGESGYFAVDQGLPRIFYITGGQFSTFPASPGKQVNGDSAGFRATLSDGVEGVFFGDGHRTETVATIGPTYTRFLGVESNDAGTLAITAELVAGGQAIVVADGRPRTFVTFADTRGVYTALGGGGRISINNRGTIVFGADLSTPAPANASGIFRGPDASVDKVIAIGDALFDSIVAGFPTNFMNPRGLNNEDQIVFRADLADGSTVLVRADPDCPSPN
jgi:hypothetical protein